MSNTSETVRNSHVVAAQPTDRLDRLYGRDFGLAFGSQVGFVMANMLMAHYARWIVFLGGDLADVGIVTGVGSVAGMLMRPWIGQWINRFGARNLWIVGYLVFVASSLGNLLVLNLEWPIFLLRGASFVGAAVVFSSSLTFVSQTAPASRQTEAIGTLGVAGFIGIVCGPLLGDVILGVEGRTRGDFENLFVIASGLLSVPLALLLFLPSGVADGKSIKLGLGDFVSTVKRYWPGGVLLVNLVFGLCMAVMMVLPWFFAEQSGTPIWLVITFDVLLALHIIGMLVPKRHAITSTHLHVDGHSIPWASLLPAKRQKMARIV
ncbi:MAG: MFS transporter, partial [Planctomycetaceae bacterium]